MIFISNDVSHLRVKASSNWKFKTSESGATATSLKTGLLSIASGKLVFTLNEIEHNFYYGAGGFGYGANIKLGKLNINFRKSVAIATENFYAKGKVFVLGGCKSEDLTEEDFTGACLFFDAGVSLIDGFSGSAFIFGLNGSDLLAASAMISNGLTRPFVGQYILSSAKGIALTMGHSRGIQAGAGISANIGYIHK